MKNSLRQLLVIGVVLFFAGSTRAVDLSKLDSLTPAQAETLVKNKASLSLNNLKTLSPEVAAVLATHEGELFLNGLTELSPEAATALARHKAVANFGRADISLNGLRTLSAATAEALATHRGALALYSLETLDSIPLAKKLTAQWGELRLGLTTLSPPIALELAKNEGVFEDRSRPGVVERRGDLAPAILRLDNLSTLSPESAEALSTLQGILVLNGLTTLDPATAAALARRKGGRASPTRLGVTLVLNGLPALSTDSAAALAEFPGELVLNAVTDLSPSTAAALARHKGRLYLRGLKTLTPEVQAALLKHLDVHLPRESLPN